MLTETASAISSIKAAFDIAKGAGALKSESEINSALIDIQRILLDAQSNALNDKERISQLSDEVRKLRVQIEKDDRWEEERKRYILTKSELGAYTYDLDASLDDGEEFHRICANCYTDGIKSILSTTSKGNGGERVNCPKCKTDFLLSKFQTRVVVSSGL